MVRTFRNILTAFRAEKEAFESLLWKLGIYTHRDSRNFYFVVIKKGGCHRKSQHHITTCSVELLVI